MTPKAEANALQKKHLKFSRNWDCYNDIPDNDMNDVRAAIITVKTIIRVLIRVDFSRNDSIAIKSLKHYKTVLKELESRLPTKYK